MRWTTVLALAVAWELVCRGPLAGNGYLAGPIEVVRDGVPSVLTGEPLQQLAHTTLRFLVAFAITALAGPAVGLALGRAHPHVYDGLRDVVAVLYSLPLVPFFPLLVLWLGLGNPSEISFGVLHGVVPVVLLTMAASADTPQVYLESSRAMGAGRVRRFASVLVPWLTPQIVGALKIGASLSLLGVLLAELMISVGGVGSFLSAQIANQQSARLDAMVGLVCVGAFALNAVLTAAERAASRWRPPAG